VDKQEQVDINAILQALSSYLLAWEGKALNEGEARAIVFPMLEYSIRMTWLGRRDKLRHETYAAINTLSGILLDKGLNFAPSQHGDAALKGQDHYALARQLFDGIWSLYLGDEQNALTKPKLATQRLTLWQWIRSIMSGKGKAS
jgi:hypothetical protein